MLQPPDCEIQYVIDIQLHGNEGAQGWGMMWDYKSVSKYPLILVTVQIKDLRGIKWS